MTTSLQTDPFEYQQQAKDYIKVGGKKNHLTIESHVVGQDDDRKGKTVDHLQAAGDQDAAENSESEGEAHPDTFNRAQNNFFEDEIVTRLQLEFRETKAKSSSHTTGAEMTTNGLWRIESPEIYEGGNVRWDQGYRLRHLTSGRYLRVTKRAGVPILLF